MRPASPAALTWLRGALTAEASLAPLTACQPHPSCLLRTTALSPSSHNPVSEPSTRKRPFSTSPSRRSDGPQTHYHFFPNSLPAGPPPAGTFHIDLSALRKEFLRLQARAHPDLHPVAHKARAQALSARINEAYKTLQSPLLRAQYLLSLRGIDVGGDEAARVEDAGLLMEVMEAREAIEEAESEEEVRVLWDVNEGRIERSVGVLEEAFRRDDVEGAGREAVRLRYWVNIKESLDAWEKGKPVVLVH